MGQLLPPLWELLTRGLAHYERHVLVAGGRDEDEVDSDQDSGGVGGSKFSVLISSGIVRPCSCHLMGMVGVLILRLAPYAWAVWSGQVRANLASLSDFASET